MVTAPNVSHVSGFGKLGFGVGLLCWRVMWWSTTRESAIFTAACKVLVDVEMQIKPFCPTLLNVRVAATLCKNGAIARQ